MRQVHATPQILVVDDTPANLLAVEISLEGCGVEVVKARSGQEALKLALQHQFALVLMDVQMPTMDGYETATLLRSSARARETPIIFLTATHGEKHAVFKGYESGAVDYIFKPVNPAILKSKVKVFAEIFRLRELEKSRVAQEEMERFEGEKRTILETENVKLRGILDNLAVGVALIQSASGRPTYCNGRYATICRAPEDWWEARATHADGRPCAPEESVLARALAGRTIKEEGRRLTFADGTLASLLVSATPIRNAAGDVTSALVSLLDVTERVAAEEAKEVAQKQLLQSYKMSAIGEMAGNIAHEVNNPLSIIVGKAQQLRDLLREQPLNAEAIGRFSTTIELTAMRIVKIVNGLRTISRKSERDVFAPCKVVSLVEDTLAFCAARLKFEGINIQVDPVPPGVLVECRAAEISQVLLNLVSNAFDAVEDLAEKWVKVTFRDEGEWVELGVADSGPGIPPELRARILEPFFTTKQAGKGTGLGLSITKNIVEDHGGELRIDEDSRHTRFVVRLPKQQAAAPRKAAS